MSVIIVTPDIVGPVKNGGIGTACFHYARSLANAGIETSVLFTGNIISEEIDKWKLYYRGMKINFFSLDDISDSKYHTHGSRWHNLRSLRIFNFLKNSGYRYILFQDWHANGFWSTRAKRMGVAFADTVIGVIAHSPNEWQKAGMQTLGQNPLEESALEWEEREAIRGADILVSPSRHMVSWLQENDYGLPQSVEFCPYTFEDKPKIEANSEIDREHLIFFGRLETRKGLHLLAGALRQLKDEGLTLPRKLSFLGKFASVEGEPSEAYLAKLATDLPGVEFFIETDFDYQQATQYILDSGGIVIIASILDNFPLTVIESIVNGFRFFASTAGGIPEMVDPRIAFEPNVASLAAAIQRRHEINFAGLDHKYKPDQARTNWIAHVTRILENPIPRPSVRRADDEGVSICIPFYKYDRFLPRLIDALLVERRSMPSMQIVLVNDGTPESECPNFLKYKGYLEEVGDIFHMQDNAGASASRNKAVELSRYDNILFFDADNLPFRGMVGKLVAALNQSGADSVAAPFVSIPAFTRRPVEGDIWWQYLPPGGPLSVSMFDNCLADMCGIQRKSTFEKIGGFNLSENYYDDWAYFLKLVGNSFDHIVYPEPLFYYAFDPNGRRTWQSEFSKRALLWRRVEDMDPASMAEVLKVLIKEIYLQRSR